MLTEQHGLLMKLVGLPQGYRLATPVFLGDAMHVEGDYSKATIPCLCSHLGTSHCGHPCLGTWIPSSFQPEPHLHTPLLPIPKVITLPGATRDLSTGGVREKGPADSAIP